MQFEDADEDAVLAAPLAPQPAPQQREASGPFVDDEMPPSDDDDEQLAEEDEDEYDDEGEYGLEEGLHAVMDQDWADAAGGAPLPLGSLVLSVR